MKGNDGGDLPAVVSEHSSCSVCCGAPSYMCCVRLADEVLLGRNPGFKGPWAQAGCAVPCPTGPSTTSGTGQVVQVQELSC